MSASITGKVSEAIGGQIAKTIASSGVAETAAKMGFGEIFQACATTSIIASACNQAIDKGLDATGYVLKNTWNWLTSPRKAPTPEVEKSVAEPAKVEKQVPIAEKPKTVHQPGRLHGVPSAKTISPYSLTL